MTLLLVARALLSISGSELDVAVSHPPGYHLDADALVQQVEQQQAFPGCVPYRVLGQSASTEVHGEEVVERLTLELDPLLPGDHLLGFYSVRLRADRGPDQMVMSNAVTLSIPEPPPAPELAQMALLPLVERPQLALSPGNRRAGSQLSHSPQKRLRLRRFFWQALLALGALTGGYFGVRRLSRYVRLPTLTRRRDPRKAALAALAALESDGLIDRAEYDYFYVRLTGIVRRFIEEAFGLRAPERTTEEFLQEASTHPHLDCGDLLQFADLVKFARLTPSSEDCSGAISSARSLVETTDQRPTYKARVSPNRNDICQSCSVKSGGIFSEQE